MIFRQSLYPTGNMAFNSLSARIPGRVAWKQGWSAVFNLDYAFTESFIRVCGLMAALTYPIFHFSEAALGYKDYLPLRISAILISVILVLFPSSPAFRRARLAYWEFTIFAILPFAQIWLFLMNPNDGYWSGSNVFWSLFLGFTTKAAWLPFQLIAAHALALLANHAVFGNTPAMYDALWAQQATIWTTALTGQGIKITLEIFHRRGLALAGANARAQEAEAREAEMKAANSELKRREDVIRRFVRPSVFEELARGADPTEFRAVNREMAIMFCDIREFTRLTEVLSAEEKQIFLNRYFSLITGPILAHGGEVDKIMGDCVMGLFPDGKAAVGAAMDMRLSLQEFNREMFAQGKPKIRNGIGIAK